MGNGGLQAFRARLHPALVETIEGWHDDPGLGSLHGALMAHTEPKAFFDSCAEAIVARHLVRNGCGVRFEVPTPSGKRCDFAVRDGDAAFFLHVKRIETDRPTERRLSISSRLRYLERIDRPYVVCIRWHDGLRDDQIQRLVTEGASFVRQASVGDEITVRDDRGAELGGLQVVAPWEGDHVRLTIGLPEGFIDDVPRMRRLMGRAYRQFMPRATNVVLLCSAHARDVADCEVALLGSHIERWDAHPPRGRRIAHGRAGDGFWHDQRHQESAIAGWFHFAPDRDGFACRTWYREGWPLEAAVGTSLVRLFGDGAAAAG